MSRPVRDLTDCELVCRRVVLLRYQSNPAVMPNGEVVAVVVVAAVVVRNATEVVKMRFHPISYF